MEWGGGEGWSLLNVLSSEMDLADFSKNLRAYKIDLISAGSISLDSTFKTTDTKRGPLPIYSLYTNTYPGACKHETFNPLHRTM
jgi:hypothetical protein